MNYRWPYALVLLTVLVVTVGSVGGCNGEHPASAVHGRTTPESAQSASAQGSGPSHAFVLIDSENQPVTDEQFRGQWLVAFFGFTHCPETCPTALFRMSKVLESLRSDAATVRIALITVDPERDTPNVLKAYLQPFGPAFVGLTGSQEQIAAVEQRFRVYAQKQAASSPGAEYSMDHGTSFYVLGPDGRFARQVSSELSTADLAATLRSIMGLTSPQAQ